MSVLRVLEVGVRGRCRRLRREFPPFPSSLLVSGARGMQDVMRIETDTMLYRPSRSKKPPPPPPMKRSALSTSDVLNY